jgi:DNA-binding transcriptional ArsR family regulator
MPKRTKATELADPPAELVIGDVEQLKAVSDPLRLSLLDIMSDDARRGWTAKELAERLETKQTKLYHHLSLLEEHGLIRVAETRVVSGILEKRYQIVARSFRVERALLTGAGSEAAVGSVLDAVFEKARTEILAGVRAGLIDLDEEDPDRRRMGLWSSHARLSPKSAKKVLALAQRLSEIEHLDEAGGAEYGVVVGFYPRATRETDR